MRVTGKQHVEITIDRQEVRSIIRSGLNQYASTIFDSLPCLASELYLDDDGKVCFEEEICTSHRSWSTRVVVEKPTKKQRRFLKVYKDLLNTWSKQDEAERIARQG